MDSKNRGFEKSGLEKVWIQKKGYLVKGWIRSFVDSIKSGFSDLGIHIRVDSAICG